MFMACIVMGDIVMAQPKLGPDQRPLPQPIADSYRRAHAITDMGSDLAAIPDSAAKQGDTKLIKYSIN